jgi:hypothetical protein
LKRDDISPDLVHFTRGETCEDAFQVLSTIARESQLRGGTGYVKGNYRCVCFSEAPIPALSRILARPGAHGVRYQPFGVVVPKAWLFEWGGRPVIYQDDKEYLLLPEVLRWRHVRYEPNSEPGVDFTWEREWRIRVDFLQINPATACFVVPSSSWVERFNREHSCEIVDDTWASSYAAITGVPEQAWVEHRYIPCQWRIVSLEALLDSDPCHA